MRHSGLWGLLIPVGVVATCGVRAPAQGDARAAIFVARGCTECHAVTELGLRAATDAGPDLSYAAEEAPIRYGVSLRRFLDDPTGVMQMVMVTHVRLTTADRDSIVALLERLDRERRGHPARFTDLPH